MYIYLKGYLLKALEMVISSSFSKKLPFPSSWETDRHDAAGVLRLLCTKSCVHMRMRGMEGRSRSPAEAAALYNNLLPLSARAAPGGDDDDCDAGIHFQFRGAAGRQSSPTGRRTRTSPMNKPTRVTACAKRRVKKIRNERWCSNLSTDFPAYSDTG